jgi:glycosyltransferase involved in cell wall biosynthesis
MRMILPALESYRNNFIEKGTVLPLRQIEIDKLGLLNHLPAGPDKKAGWPWTEQVDCDTYNLNTNWPKLTIVTPSFNQGQFLEETIRSVLLQNYPNLEYIVIDGGSTDNSLQILEKYSQWINYWHSKKDNGQGQAINLGFSLGSGKYHAWINSDDYYVKDAFNIVVTKFLATNTDFIYGYGYSYDVTNKTYSLVKTLPLLDFFLKIPTLIQPSTFWNSKIHQPVWEEIHCSLDFELWMRLVKGNKRSCIARPLSVANIHTQAKTYDPNMKIKWDLDEKKIWSNEGHGAVPHWHKVNYLNRLRYKFYKAFKLI